MAFDNLASMSHSLTERPPASSVTTTEKIFLALEYLRSLGGLMETRDCRAEAARAINWLVIIELALEVRSRASARTRARPIGVSIMMSGEVIA